MKDKDRGGDISPCPQLQNLKSPLDEQAGVEG